MKLWQGLAALGAGLATFAVARKLGEAGKGNTDVPDGPIDDYAPQETTKAGQCDPTAKVGVKMFRTWWISQWGEKAGQPQNILRDCSVGSPSEHWEGRAWDWTFVDQASAKAALAALFATDGAGNENSLLRRAGVMYVIFDRQMWRAYPHGSETRVWAPYTGPDPHDTHVHFSFSWAGARAETSLYEHLAELQIA